MLKLKNYTHTHTDRKKKQPYWESIPLSMGPYATALPSELADLLLSQAHCSIYLLPVHAVIGDGAKQISLCSLLYALVLKFSS